MNGKIERLYLIDSKSFIPYHNQALEEFLLNNVDQESLILYLWQNRNTIVIGKNQNPFNECDVRKLEDDGGYLARRLSGGGAVYHDLGNLNFTFLSHKNNYDIEKQTKVILDAIIRMGLSAEKNGRNDLLIDGKKFSGHAYYSRGDRCYHHGTIMYDVDENALSGYLRVSKLKLKDKAVSSVRSRVINLKKLKKDLTIDEIKTDLISSLMDNYGSDIQTLQEESLDPEEIGKLEKRYSSEQWRYGKQKNYQYSIEKKFDFGIVRVEYDLSGDTIADLAIYTDSIETESIEELIGMLIGKDIGHLGDIGYDNIQKQITDFIAEERKCMM